MKLMIAAIAVVITLTGCSKSIGWTTYIDRPIASEKIVNQQLIEQRQNFIDLVLFVRDSKNASYSAKDEALTRIRASGFDYICEHNNCFMYRNQLKVQIHSDHIWIQYPDKSYKRLWDTSVAVDQIYKS